MTDLYFLSKATNHFVARLQRVVLIVLNVLIHTYTYLRFIRAMKHITKLKNISQNIAQIHNIRMKLIICIHSMCDNSENAR